MTATTGLVHRATARLMTSEASAEPPPESTYNTIALTNWSRSARRRAATTVSEPAVGPVNSPDAGRLRPETIAPTTGTTATPGTFLARRRSAIWSRTSSSDLVQSWSTGTAISSSQPMRVISPASSNCWALVKSAPSSASRLAAGETDPSQDCSAESRYVVSCSRSWSSMWSSEKRFNALLYSRIRRFSKPMPRRVRNSP